VAYKLTRKAAADLRHIYAEGMVLIGEAQAARYHEKLRHTFAMLADNPAMARERIELSPPVRIHPCGSHIIIYMVEADSTIPIVRVRHGREDWIDAP